MESQTHEFVVSSRPMTETFHVSDDFSLRMRVVDVGVGPSKGVSFDFQMPAKTRQKHHYVRIYLRYGQYKSIARFKVEFFGTACYLYKMQLPALPDDVPCSVTITEFLDDPDDDSLTYFLPGNPSAIKKLVSDFGHTDPIPRVVRRENEFTCYISVVLHMLLHAKPFREFVGDVCGRNEGNAHQFRVFFALKRLFSTIVRRDWRLDDFCVALGLPKLARKIMQDASEFLNEFIDVLKFELRDDPTGLDELERLFKFVGDTEPRIEKLGTVFISELNWLDFNPTGTEPPVRAICCPELLPVVIEATSFPLVIGIPNSKSEEPLLYELISVAVFEHDHYRAYIADCDGTWFCLDDTHKRSSERSSLGRLKIGRACLLLYQKVSSRKLTPIYTHTPKDVYRKLRLCTIHDVKKSFFSWDPIFMHSRKILCSEDDSLQAKLEAELEPAPGEVVKFFKLHGHVLASMEDMSGPMKADDVVFADVNCSGPRCSKPRLLQRARFDPFTREFVQDSYACDFAEGVEPPQRGHGLWVLEEEDKGKYQRDDVARRWHLRHDWSMRWIECQCEFTDEEVKDLGMRRNYEGFAPLPIIECIGNARPPGALIELMFGKSRDILLSPFYGEPDLNKYKSFVTPYYRLNSVVVGLRKVTRTETIRLFPVLSIPGVPLFVSPTPLPLGNPPHSSALFDRESPISLYYSTVACSVRVIVCDQKICDVDANSEVSVEEIISGLIDFPIEEWNRTFRVMLLESRSRLVEKILAPKDRIRGGRSNPPEIVVERIHGETEVELSKFIQVVFAVPMPDCPNDVLRFGVTRLIPKGTPEEMLQALEDLKPAGVPCEAWFCFMKTKQKRITLESIKENESLDWVLVLDPGDVQVTPEYLWSQFHKVRLYHKS